MKAFLGFAGYYQRFFEDLATLGKPLNRLTFTGEDFVWGREQEHTFSILQTIMVEALAMAYPDPSNIYVLDTDAGAGGTGAVLSQCLEGQERVVAYFNKTFSPCHRNYCVTRRDYAR